MSFKHLLFELSPEQIESRNKLGESLLENSAVKTFQLKYSCPDEVIVLHASRFKRWLDERHLALSRSEHEIRETPELGAYIDLVYDATTGVLDEVFQEVGFVQKIAKDREYLSRYKVFDLPISLEEAHFENLNIEEEGINFLKILSELQTFENNDKLGHFLYGDMGVGKSYLAACVSNSFAKHGKNVAFVHVPTLMNYLKQLFNRPEAMQATIRSLCRIPLLVLDDLGAEPITSWSRDEILLTIMNDRLENKRKTLITSNYIPNDLVTLYKVDNRGASDEIRATRLVERITALTQGYEMIGKNRRKA
ncbi:MAG: ATP-binding protein [Erysipelothrix sp.]|nr:ATP-binding protein [Erysipelothrix sp.]